MFLLDTNACVQFLRNRNDLVVQRIQSRRLDELRLCAAVIAELCYGWLCSAQPAANRAKVDKFIQPYVSLPVVEYLPAYAPELNPVQWLWSRLKDVELSNKACMDLEELHGELHVAIARIRQHPGLILSFFEGAGLSLDELYS